MTSRESRQDGRRATFTAWSGHRPIPDLRPEADDEMPTRPLTRCTVPGCPTRVAHPGRCARHRSDVMRVYNRAPARRSAMRAYGGAWSSIRRVVLLEEPICQGWPNGSGCGDSTREVDHVVPLRDGGTHDRANLRAMCPRCHKRKTADEHRGAGGRFVTR